MSIGRQFVRFLMVGGACTAFHYLVLIGLVHLGWAAVPASSLGFSLSAVLNYALNRRLTFRSDAAHRRAVPRFALVALSGLALNAALLGLLHDGLGWHYLLAQVFATVGTLVWNFTLNRVWTFSTLTAGNAPPGGSCR
jgi:putative flippase GtrA